MLAALAHPLAPHLTASHPVSDNEVSNYAVAGPLKRVLAAPLVEESGVGRWRHHTRRDLRAPYGSYNQTVVAVPDECHRESWDHNCQQNRLDRDEPGNEISCLRCTHVRGRYASTTRRGSNALIFVIIG